MLDDWLLEGSLNSRSSLAAPYSSSFDGWTLAVASDKYSSKVSIFFLLAKPVDRNYASAGVGGWLMKVSTLMCISNEGDHMRTSPDTLNRIYLVNSATMVLSPYSIHGEAENPSFDVCGLQKARHQPPRDGSFAPFFC